MNTRLKSLLKEVSPVLSIFVEHNGDNYPVFEVVPGTTITAGEDEEIPCITINFIGEFELTWEVLEPLAKYFINRPKTSWSLRATDAIDENHGPSLAIDIF